MENHDVGVSIWDQFYHFSVPVFFHFVEHQFKTGFSFGKFADFAEDVKVITKLELSELGK